eukprot:116078-Hanusia_phi.AAC.1
MQDDIRMEGVSERQSRTSEAARQGRGSKPDFHILTSLSNHRYFDTLHQPPSRSCNHLPGGCASFKETAQRPKMKPNHDIYPPQSNDNPCVLLDIRARARVLL